MSSSSSSSLGGYGSFVSSSALGSSSSLSSTLAPKRWQYFLIKIPDVAEHEVLAFDDLKDMLLALRGLIEDKNEGLYSGEIMAMQGRMIEFSDPIVSFRVNVPEAGEYEITGGTRGKYGRYLPKNTS